jgi:hypothetical protein
MRRFPFGRLLLGTCIATAVAATISLGPTFTAPAGADGWNSHRVSGYAVSGVHYVLDGNNVRGVTFELDARATQARVNLGGGWTSCEVSGRSVSCSLPSEQPLASVSSLSVSASS